MKSRSIHDVLEGLNNLQVTELVTIITLAVIHHQMSRLDMVLEGMFESSDSDADWALFKDKYDDYELALSHFTQHKMRLFK